MSEKPQKDIQTCSNCSSTFDLSTWGFQDSAGRFACTAQCADTLTQSMARVFETMTLSELSRLPSAREQLQQFPLYTLDDVGNPCFEPDVTKWAYWIESNPEALTLAVDERPIPGGATAVITTVFLGRDCNPHGKTPHLFETDVTFGSDDKRTPAYRCATRTEALQAHADTIEFIKLHGGPKSKGQPPSPNRMKEQ